MIGYFKPHERKRGTLNALLFFLFIESAAWRDKRGSQSQQISLARSVPGGKGLPLFVGKPGAACLWPAGSQQCSAVFHAPSRNQGWSHLWPLAPLPFPKVLPASQAALVASCLPAGVSPSQALSHVLPGPLFRHTEARCGAGLLPGSPCAPHTLLLVFMFLWLGSGRPQPEAQHLVRSLFVIPMAVWGPTGKAEGDTLEEFSIGIVILSSAQGNTCSRLG